MKPFALNAINLTWKNFFIKKIKKEIEWIKKILKWNWIN